MVVHAFGDKDAAWCMEVEVMTADAALKMTGRHGALLLRCCWKVDEKLPLWRAEIMISPSESLRRMTMASVKSISTLERSGLEGENAP